jgi:hypothetical protein
MTIFHPTGTIASILPLPQGFVAAGQVPSLWTLIGVQCKYPLAVTASAKPRTPVG